VTSTRPPSGLLLGRITGSYPLAETYHLDALRDEMVGITEEVSTLVPQATGLALTGSPTTEIISRVEWVGRNQASFNHLLEPARQKLLESAVESGGSRSAAALANRFVNVETTALLGVLARRVLGQYELVLPTGEQGDVVTYVGANIIQMERNHQFRPHEFRFWVALHELTHRAQFQGVPWLRDYFLSLVTELVESSRPEPGRLARVFDEMNRRRSRGQDMLDERGIFGLFASEDQREVIDKVQALMSLLEGHGHVVMDRVGSEILKSQKRMSQVLKGRRQDRRTAALFRLLGLEMKMKQYRLGEEFIKGVEREAGWSTVSLAFRGASSLPTILEIEDPDAWLRRVA
jgi:coenzyme F420 biosynthesis associated uncharacterized protein